MGDLQWKQTAMLNWYVFSGDIYLACSFVRHTGRWETLVKFHAYGTDIVVNGCSFTNIDEAKDACRHLAATILCEIRDKADRYRKLFDD